MQSGVLIVDKVEAKVATVVVVDSIVVDKVAVAVADKAEVAAVAAVVKLVQIPLVPLSTAEFSRARNSGKGRTCMLGSIKWGTLTLMAVIAQVCFCIRHKLKPRKDSVRTQAS